MHKFIITYFKFNMCIWVQVQSVHLSAILLSYLQHTRTTFPKYEFWEAQFENTALYNTF